MEGTLLNKAKTAFNESNYDLTLSILNELLDTDEFHLEGILMRAIVFRKLSMFDESLLGLDKLINLLPKEAEFYAERGVTHLHMKQLDLSLQDMNTAAELEPENPYRYSSRAYVKDKIGDDDGAREDYEKAVELDPDDEVAYNNLGLILEKAGKKKAALKNFEKSNDSLEKKYGIKIGNGEIRPYTFKDELIPESKNNSVQEKKPTRKVSWKDYVMVLKKLMKDKSERKAFLDFIKKN